MRARTARHCAHKKRVELDKKGGFPDDHTTIATRCLRCGAGFITVEWASRSGSDAAETRRMTLGEQRRYVRWAL